MPTVAGHASYNDLTSTLASLVEKKNSKANPNHSWHRVLSPFASLLENKNDERVKYRNNRRRSEQNNDARSVASKPAIAQLVEHLTVDSCSNQMVPGSIPGGRIFANSLALLRLSVSKLYARANFDGSISFRPFLSGPRWHCFAYAFISCMHV